MIILLFLVNNFLYGHCIHVYFNTVSIMQIRIVQTPPSQFVCFSQNIHMFKYCG